MVARRWVAWHGIVVFNSSLRYRPSRRVLGFSGLSVVILVLGSHASGSAAEGPYPGLPYHADIGGGWTCAAQGGITEATKARQWAQVPMQMGAVYNVLRGYPYTQPDELDRSSRTEYTANIYLIPSAGSEHNYGMSPKFAVRTVAFGAIPVEATLQLIQRRNAEGLPIPIVVKAQDTSYNNGPLEPGGPARPPRNTTEDTRVEDAVTLRVTRLVVDGIDLGLGNRCQTAGPGKLSLFGKGWRHGIDPADTQKPWNTGHYSLDPGGLMTGTVDVPAFAGCLTSSGEDVSRLLTSAVSSAGNTVKLHVSGPKCGQRIPPAPGVTTPDAAGCNTDSMPPQIPIP